MTEEIFGPVAVVIPFDGEAEAIALANDTIYGLSRLGLDARRRARRCASRARVEAGNLSVNSNTSVRVAHAVRRLQAVGRRARARARTRPTHYTEVKTDLLRDGGA